MNAVLNGWNNIPRRGKIFIAKNIFQHTFDPDGVAPHLNKLFFKYLIPSGLSKTSKKKEPNNYRQKPPHRAHKGWR